jgi:hypothetical protein
MMSRRLATGKMPSVRLRPLASAKLGIPSGANTKSTSKGPVLICTKSFPATISRWGHISIFDNWDSTRATRAAQCLAQSKDTVPHISMRNGRAMACVVCLLDFTLFVECRDVTPIRTPHTGSRIGSYVSLRQWCVKGKTAAATVRGRPPKRNDLLDERGKLPNEAAYVVDGLGRRMLRGVHRGTIRHLEKTYGSQNDPYPSISRALS